MKKLSILIPTIASRVHYLERLLQRLLPQRVDGVEVIVESDNGEMTIGEKRNRLMSKARGEWVCYIDDDDMVSEKYVAKILAALALNPDCVGFKVRRYVNGIFDADAIHSIRYAKYATYSDGISRIYERTPNHLNPIRRSLAIQVPFLSCNRGEDSDYAERVYPLLESEVFIDIPLYSYLWIPNEDRLAEYTNELRRSGLTPEEWFAANAQEGAK